MNRFFRPFALSAAILSSAVAAPARAQAPALHFLVSAGAALPTGTLSNNNDLGYQIAAGVETKSTGTPMGIRLEGSYAEFNNSGIGGKTIADGGSANLVYNLTGSTSGTSPANAVALYAIGGVGYYGTREPHVGLFTNSQTNVGWNLGGGFRFPLSGFDVYVEARYLGVNSTDVHYVPITFGVVF